MDADLAIGVTMLLVAGALIALSLQGVVANLLRRRRK